MNTLAHVPDPAEFAAWLAALEALKATEAEVRRARGALNEARITNAYFDQGDEGGDWQLLFEVVVQNLHNGHDETITRRPGGFEFV